MVLPPSGSFMATTRCPRCGGMLADAATSCAACERPVTLDVTARVPKRRQSVSRRPVISDAILASGGIAGIIAASTSANGWIAGSVVLACVVAALMVRYL